MSQLFLYFPGVLVGNTLDLYLFFLYYVGVFLSIKYIYIYLYAISF